MRGCRIILMMAVKGLGFIEDHKLNISHNCYTAKANMTVSSEFSVVVLS